MRYEELSELFPFEGGLWDWNIETGDCIFSPEWYEMLEYKEGELPPKISSWENLLKEEDLLLAEGATENHFRFQTPFEIKVRAKTKSGKWKWVLSRGKVIEWKKDGSPLRMIGTHADIDHEKASEEKLHLLHSRLIDAIESLEAGFAIFDREERLVVANKKYQEHFSLANDILQPGVTSEAILRAINPSESWMVRELAHFRDPGMAREERFNDKWLRHVEKRTTEGGVVSLVTDITERKQAEQALYEARLREAEAGFQIQTHLLFGRLPKQPEGFDIYPLTVPSEGIDGDFYDFFLQEKGNFDLVLGDVMGKGISAALLGAGTKSAFSRALIHFLKKDSPEPEEIVTFVHHDLSKEMISLETFLTLTYARFDRNQGKVTFVDAGHTPTLFFKKKTETIERLTSQYVPFGFLKEELYTQEEIAFEEGDVFLFYSDGVTESRSPNEELFGIKRLESVLSAHYALTAQEIGQAVVREVQSFSDFQPIRDDLTLIVVKISQKSPQLIEEKKSSFDAKIEELHAVRDFVRTFCENLPKRDWEAVKTFHLELAISEAVTNIIQHALQDLKKGSIQLHIERLEDRILIHIEYTGIPFKPGKIIPPKIEELQERGFGLYIIEKLMDSVEYVEHEPGKQRITLIKIL